MADDGYLQGDGADRAVLTRPLEERGVKAIEAFFREHHEQLVKIFADLGLDWKTVAQPGWARFIVKADMEKLTWLGDRS